MTNKVLGLVMATALAVLGGCAAGESPAPPAPAGSATRTPTSTTSATSTSPTASATATSASAATSASVPPGTVTKLLVFVVENHSLDQMRADMPYTASLGKRFGLATSYRAVTHPSLPNYLAMTGGSTFGVTDDDPPSSHPIDQPSVFGQALSLGRTARLYAEGMPTNCATEDSGRYAVRHNPWTYHVAERSSCARFDVPLGRLGTDASDGSLPDAGMVIPDVCNDAHDCDLSTADSWLRTQTQAVMAGPDWRSGHLAIVVTADEDDHGQGNLVLTTVAHPSLHGAVVTTPLTHYSLARLYSEVLGAQPLGEAASAPSMATAFGLHLAAG
ncbi:alkaline phosphatase family protein [Intrasporangium flavum]|uniref:alkaline phosphatase family protein n=1 Tax=Intrasporangium flavum TaxID=1428657 RepID=UPI001A96B21C|nr:alkaline phosphatase family protein [Intrasporangium flavum]